MPAMSSWLVPCLCCFFLVSSVLSESQIPKQLIMTGKPESLEEMPAAVRTNVEHTLSLAGKDMKFRWFGDQTCRHYIQEHYDTDLLRLFDQADPGYYRGDICRAAVLYQEGGFYLDVDVELHVPLAELVDENTTFTSAYSRNSEVYNAIIATVPKSEILAETLNEIRKWNGEGQHHSESSFMGTFTLFHGMQTAVNTACKVDDLLKKRHNFTWTCGHHNIRMYNEGDLWCPSDPECPPVRFHSRHYGMRMGLFPAGQEVKINRPFIGWSRFSACADDADGCGSGGHLHSTSNAPATPLTNLLKLAADLGQPARPEGKLMRMEVKPREFRPVNMAA